MINPTLPSHLGNLLAPFNPVGQRPVGEEDSAGRISTFKPVEQPGETARQTLRAPNPEQTPTASDETRSPAADSEDSETGVDRQQSQREARQLERDQQEIAQLAARDREVRAHEQAHAAVGGQYAGAAQFQYQRGPDGVRYAVSGEVPIDVGREATPQATITKMQVVKRAALAPAEPSPQDRRVAAEATRIETEARQELRVEQAREDAESEQSANNGQAVDGAQNTARDTSGLDSDNETESDNPQTLAPINNVLSTRLNLGVANASLTSNEPGSILDQLV